MRLSLGLLILLFSHAAPAHQQSLSYSQWQETQQGLRVNLRHSAVDLSRAQLHPAQPDYLRNVTSFLSRHHAVQRGDMPCRVHDALSHQLADGWIATRIHWRCQASGELVVRLDGLFDHAPDHNNLARWQDLAGNSYSQVFNETQRLWSPQQNQIPLRWSSFFILGIEHILSGWDHLAFLLALLLLVKRSSDLLWLVSAFTLAHSLTLASTTLGYTAPDQIAVEIVIALSILMLCLENAWRQSASPALKWCTAGLVVLLALSPKIHFPVLAGLSLFGFCYTALLLKNTGHQLHWRAALCFAFGLFHGFGFSSVLREMRIPLDQQLSCLLGFNLGVEAGQLLFVLPLSLLLGQLGRRSSQLALPALNAAAGSLASYWLLLRLFA